MGDRGPDPTPTAIKEARGTVRRHTVKNEPKPRTDGVRVPSGLSARAKTVWKALLPELQALNLATVVDVYALHRYCSAVAEWRKLDEYLNKRGLTHTVMMSTGIEKVEARPEVALRLQAHTVCLQIEKQFGLTPAARVRLVSGGEGTGSGHGETEEEKAARKRREFMANNSGSPAKIA